ncbi:MAG TPA: 50S ribosomal protein L33 [Candidatus Paceibacterota bacterium]
MSQLHLVTLKSKETGEYVMTRVNAKRRLNYSQKNFKLKLMKFSKLLRKHVLFEETKKIFKK